MLVALRGPVHCPTCSTRRCHHVRAGFQRRIDRDSGTPAVTTNRSRRMPGTNHSSRAPVTPTAPATTRNAARAKTVGLTTSRLDPGDTPDEQEADHFEDEPGRDQLRAGGRVQERIEVPGIGETEEDSERERAHAHDDGRPFLRSE